MSSQIPGEEGFPWRYFLTLLLTAIGTIVVATLVGKSFANLSSVSTERITAASNAIIQLDSFLSAGFVVGFFYFWQRMEELWEKGRKDVPPGPTSIVVAFSPLAVILLVASGLESVWAIATLDMGSLGFSVALLIAGLWAVFSTWYSLSVILRDVEKSWQSKQSSG